MSTPNSNNIYVGAGIVYFNRFDSSGNPTQWRDLGEVSKLELTTNAQTIDKNSSRTGTRALVARVVTGVSGDLAMTMDEWDPENVALALLGVTATFSQTSGTATDTSLGTANVKKGYGLSTGKLKITVTAVKKGASVAVLNTDYTVDSDAGIINILPGSSLFSDGDSATWSGTYPTITSTQIQALANAIIQGSLRFVSAADAYGPRFVIDVWKVQITPDGALSLLSAQYGEIGVKGSVLLDSTKPVGNQFFQAVKL